MSRRDTIIIAVLVNAGLLMVLFATAMSSKDETPDNKPNIQLVENTAPQSKQINTPSQEEMDHVLNQYVAAAPTLSEIPSQDIVVVAPSVISALPAETKLPTAPIINSNPAPTQNVSVPNQTAVVASNSDSSFVSVTVKKGDYLDKIAKNNGSSVNDIMKANQLDSTQLKIGQVLRVPVKSTTSPSVASKDLERKSIEATKNFDPEYYVVKNGDNPWLIASKNQVKLEDLLRLNNLDDQKAKKLKPGDRLRIR